MREITVAPSQPYSLGRSMGFEGDATRRFRDGVLHVALASGGVATVWQAADGTLSMRVPAATAEAALAELRFLLTLDDDLAPFHRLAARDRLLRDVVLGQAGVRPVRVSTVAHALLRALCGQLISAREARAIENRVLRRCDPAAAGLRRPPDARALGALTAAEVEGCGLAGRRAEALVRVARFVDLERLRLQPTPAVAARLQRERTLGPWSAGVVAIYGLGRHDLGLVGDLGLVRLLRALRGRPVEAAETAELLEPYAEWAGLASLWLMRHPLAGRGEAGELARRPRRSAVAVGR